MRYVGTVKDDVIVAKGINYTDYVDPNEIELTEEQYNTIPIPCKLIDNEFVECEFPKYDDEVEIIEEPITDMEQLRADVDYIAIMTGVEL